MRGEVICVGDDIEISIEDVRGNKVRVGVTAPREVRVDRKEIRERIDKGIPQQGK